MPAAHHDNVIHEYGKKLLKDRMVGVMEGWSIGLVKLTVYYHPPLLQYSQVFIS
jgi:hypothetical protein